MPEISDAFAFNLPFTLNESNISVTLPSTLKELRQDTTPGDIYGEFDWEVRRDEHDATTFVFEIRVPGRNLSQDDFGSNLEGCRFMTRINGILFNGNPQNRGFSKCP